jgi:inositol oxygenase
MFLWGTPEDGQDGTTPLAKQWALGGDTFVVGCKIPNVCVFPQFNQLNPDMQNPDYNTEYGVYKPNCGLDELMFAWGHDEYMYRMLVANNTTIPREGLDMIRYHSAYPMHDRGAYNHLLKDEDGERMEWIKLFNRFDLYTKDAENDIRGDSEDLWPYYRDLLEKYQLGGMLKW